MIKYKRRTIEIENNLNQHNQNRNQENQNQENQNQKKLKRVFSCNEQLCLQLCSFWDIFVTDTHTHRQTHTDGK